MTGSVAFRLGTRPADRCSDTITPYSPAFCLERATQRSGAFGRSWRVSRTLTLPAVEVPRRASTGRAVSCVWEASVSGPTPTKWVHAGRVIDPGLQPPGVTRLARRGGNPTIPMPVAAQAPMPAVGGPIDLVNPAASGVMLAPAHAQSFGHADAGGIAGPACA